MKSNDRYIIDCIEKNRMVIALIIGVVGLIVVVVCSAMYSRKTTNSLSDQMIRFHVVANSDTADDQLLKQKVRDEVINYIKPLMKESSSLEETKYILQGSLPTIKQISEEVVYEWGRDYPVYVALDRANFPTKSYGDVMLPAGEYEACRIIIGQGKGENWWCVMYPPLCYLDAATGVVPLEGKEQLKRDLNKEQYELVTHGQDKKYEVRFKLVETLNSFFCKADYKTKH